MGIPHDVSAASLEVEAQRLAAAMDVEHRGWSPAELMAAATHIFTTSMAAVRSLDDARKQLASIESDVSRALGSLEDANWTIGKLSKAFD